MKNLKLQFKYYMTNGENMPCFLPLISIIGCVYCQHEWFPSTHTVIHDPFVRSLRFLYTYLLLSFVYYTNVYMTKFINRQKIHFEIILQMYMPKFENTLWFLWDVHAQENTQLYLISQLLQTLKADKDLGSFSNS